MNVIKATDKRTAGNFAGTERLEKQNSAFNNLYQVDNLITQHGRNGSQTLDEMVGMEYPDFDIFDYVDPALNAALESELEKYTVHCDNHSIGITQPDLNSNLLAMHFQPPRNEVPQQNELLSQLQKHFSNSMAMWRKQMPVSMSIVRNDILCGIRYCEKVYHVGSVGIVTAENLSPLSNDYSNTQEVESTHSAPNNRRGTIEPSDEDSPDTEQHHQSEEVTPHPSGTLQKDASNELGEGTLRKKKEVRSNGEKGGARNIKNWNSSREDALKFRKPQTYTCGECNKQFHLKKSLTSHLRIHAGESHTCGECNKQFNKKSNLTRHLRLHAGERPHKCELCNLSFNSKKSLSSHSKIHIGDGE